MNHRLPKFHVLQERQEWSINTRLPITTEHRLDLRDNPVGSACKKKAVPVTARDVQIKQQPPCLCNCLSTQDNLGKLSEH